MAVDALDPCGIYFGTTGGQVYASADSDDTWNPMGDAGSVLWMRRDHHGLALVP